MLRNPENKAWAAMLSFIDGSMDQHELYETLKASSDTQLAYAFSNVSKDFNGLLGQCMSKLAAAYDQPPQKAVGPYVQKLKVAESFSNTTQTWQEKRRAGYALPPIHEMTTLFCDYVSSAKSVFADAQRRLPQVRQQQSVLNPNKMLLAVC